MLRLLFPKGVSFRALLRSTYHSFFEKGGPTTAAALAYFSLITLFPAFLLLVALGDQFIKIHGVSREVAEQVLMIFPAETRHFILTNLDTMISAPSLGSIVTYASIFVWAGMWAFHLVEEAMDKAWNVEVRKSFWVRKLTNLFMIGVTTLSFIGSTTLLAFIGILRARLSWGEMTWGTMLFQAVLGLSAYLLMAMMFTVIYKVLPNTRVYFTEALSGGLIASLLWQIANTIFVWTIPYFHYEEIYGSVWAIIVIAVWVYVSCWIMLIGAHISFHLHRSDSPANGKPAPPPVPAG
jgi:membrane protein